MPRFLCYATENRYQGLHGIESIFVEEASDISSAQEDCFQACIELMQSYGDIEEELIEEALFYLDEDKQDDEEAIAEALYECQCENACVQVWEIDESKTRHYPTHILDALAYKDMEQFIKDFCIKE